MLNINLMANKLILSLVFDKRNQILHYKYLDKYIDKDLFQK